MIAFTCEFQLRACVVSQMLVGVGDCRSDGSGTCSFADEVVVRRLELVYSMLDGEDFRRESGDMDRSQQEEQTYFELHYNIMQTLMI